MSIFSRRAAKLAGLSPGSLERAGEKEKRAKQRARSRRFLANEQEVSLRFLAYARDNPNFPPGERIRAALALLNRGDWPEQTANLHAIANLDETFSIPKLVTIGKFGADRERHDPSGNGAATNGGANGNGSSAEVLDEPPK